jgi:hypothetical protein
VPARQLRDGELGYSRETRNSVFPNSNLSPATAATHLREGAVRWRRGGRERGGDLFAGRSSPFFRVPLVEFRSLT